MEDNFCRRIRHKKNFTLRVWLLMENNSNKEKAQIALSLLLF
jgi:hypothetical protein